MNKSRVEALSDGVFAIVMTLLVIEIKVPEIPTNFSDLEMWHALHELVPLFSSYILSFAVVTGYWVSHSFLISYFAKNIDRILIYLNLLFLMSISLIPFSANLLGFYNQNNLSTVWYGVHLLIIASILYIIRMYIIQNPKIENQQIEKIDLRYSKIRIWLPITTTILGILFSFINTGIATLFYILPLFITLIPGAIALLDQKVGRFLGR